MERRSDDRVEVKLQVVWAARGVGGVGILRNLSRSGAWIDGVRARPGLGANVRVIIMEEHRDGTLVEGAAVRRTSSGFAVELNSGSSIEVECLLDRLAKDGSLG